MKRKYFNFPTKKSNNYSEYSECKGVCGIYSNNTPHNNDTVTLHFYVNIHKSFSPHLCIQPLTEATEQLETSMSSRLLEASSSSEEAPADEETDGIFLPPSSKSTSTQASYSDSEAASAGDPGQLCVRRWIVNEPQLLQLFVDCHQCCVDDQKLISSGSKIRIEWNCLAGHSGVWQSCPDVRGMPENNILSSAAILFTGTTETEISEWAEVLKLQLPKKTAYYSVQSAYLMPVVHEAYTEMQEELLTYMREILSAGKSLMSVGMQGG